MKSTQKDPQFVCVGTIPLQEAESTLDEECAGMIGERVCVGTINGHGWYHRGHEYFPGYPGVPPAFHAAIGRFFAFRMNPRRGFFATIEEVGHPLDGWGMVCCTRHAGRFNFTDRPAAYNLLVCPDEPRLGNESDPNCTPHWPAFYPHGEVYSTGFGDIAESIDWITDAFEKRKHSQKR